MLKYVIVMILLLITNSSFSQFELSVPRTIPDSLAYKAIVVGAKAKIEIFTSSFTSPFFIVHQDFDDTITLLCTHPYKVRYYEQGQTPIKTWQIIYVQIRNMRIVGKKIEIIEKSMR